MQSLRKIVFFTVLFFMSMPSLWALDKAHLQDTLSTIAARHASIGKVKVTQIKQRSQRIDVYTNPSLSYLSISPALLDSLCDAVNSVAGTRGKVVIYSDGRDLSELVTDLEKGRKGKKHTLRPTTPLKTNASRPYETGKGLEGRHIALYGSHGLYFYQAEERWLWQRARMFTTVEDLYTTSYVMPFLVPMLENAGAIVLQARERDRQTAEVIVDDSEANNGAWVNVVDGGWGAIPEGILYEGENPFTFGGYAYEKCDKNGTSLRYTPTLPKADHYGVYISYKTVEGSTDEAHYAVVHKGIRTEYLINQQMGGGTWIYLDGFDFGTNPEENYVEVSSEGRPSKVVTSDAVRFGGGMGNVARFAQSELLANVPSAQENGSQNAKKNRKPGERPTYPTREQVRDFSYISGVPRWIEGARYWFQYSGIPDSVYNYTEGKNDYTDDYASRGRWINWLAGGSEAYPDGPGLGIPVELGLAFHTDAGTTMDNSIIGTLLIYTDYDDEKKKNFPDGTSRILARDYADYMQTQLVNDIRATYAPEWQRRRLHNSSYAESRNPKVPTVLLEFLSHQNFADMKYGLDPGFRFVASRAIYKGMLRFLHEQYGTPYVVQPLPVQDFAIRFGEGNTIEMSWQPRVDSLEETATPTGYVIYTREPGKDWDNGVFCKESHFLRTIDADKQYDFKVCAVNDGGSSFPSEILSAHKASNEQGRVLIINGFTRVAAPDHFESKDSTVAGFMPNHYGVAYGHEVGYIGEQFEFNRPLPWQSDDHCGFGASYNDKRNISPIGNTFDYPSMHGRILAEQGFSFVSSSAGAIEEISDDWTFVDLILGKQKTTTIGTQHVQTLFPCFPDNLRAALAAYHGNLLVAGSYIGEDMQQKADQDWTQRVLHYTFCADNASRAGEIVLRKPFTGTAQLVTEMNEDILPCERPNGIKPYSDKARSIARYADSGISAGIVYEGRNKQVVLGFCLESLTNFDDLYRQLIEFLH